MGLFDIFKKKDFDNIRYVTDETFQRDVIERSFKQPVMVDFWADWCGPCKQLKPTLEKMASEDAPYAFVLARTDENEISSSRLGVSSIPDVRMFRNGEVVGSFKGVQFEHNIRKWVGDVLGKPAPKMQVRLPSNEEDRLALGVQEIVKGHGFQATVALDSVELAAAAVLKPLARFLWDGNDGDLTTSKTALTELYFDALDQFDEKNWGGVIAKLTEAKEMGSAVEKSRTNDVIVAVQQLQTYLAEK